MGPAAKLQHSLDDALSQPSFTRAQNVLSTEEEQEKKTTKMSVRPLIFALVSSKVKL